MNNDLLLKGDSCDILIRDGVVFGRGNNFDLRPRTRIVDARGLLVTKGFTDLHVHLREPGFTSKETILTGTRAAARGGFTTVCAMPNLNPVPDCPENLGKELEAIRRDAVVEVLPYASITKGRKGRELVDFAALQGNCVAFSDDGSGVQDGEVMLAAMKEAARLGCIIAAHCEDDSLLDGGYIHKGRYCLEHGHRGICSESEWKQIERDLSICEQTGCRYHVCHVSTAESVALIREAKARGVRVSCETAPHYLLLCEDDLQEDGRFKMNPPLRTAEDRDALVEALRDGTIDAIATDHAPHTMTAKMVEFDEAPFGIIGLETALPLTYGELVAKGVISLPELVKKFTAGPAEILGMENYSLAEGNPADLVVFDPEEHYTIDKEKFKSNSRNTPFDGWEVQCRVKLTMVGGKIVYHE